MTLRDLNILYFGGSGGFLFLHLLLLSDQYWCSVTTDLYDRWIEHARLDPKLQAYVMDHVKLPESDYTAVKLPSWPTYEQYLDTSNHLLDGQKQLLECLLTSLTNNKIRSQVANDHWPELVEEMIKLQWSPRDSWKSSELWPNNIDTISNPAPAVYHKIYYTCNDVQDWTALPGYPVILWTDLKTNIRMSWFKSAGWFFNWAKDKCWSQAKSILTTCSVEVDGKVLHQDLAQVWNHPTAIKIRLQDLVNNPIKTLSLFGVKYNERHHALIKLWKKQHPDMLLNKSGIA